MAEGENKNSGGIREKEKEEKASRWATCTEATGLFLNFSNFHLQSQTS